MYGVSRKLRRNSSKRGNENLYKILRYKLTLLTLRENDDVFLNR